MPSLNQNADSILTLWNGISISNPRYQEYQEVIKERFKNLAALYIRRDAERNPASKEFYQELTVQLEEVNKFELCKIDVLTCIVMKSKNPLPEITRLKADTNFRFVGSIDRSKVFAEIDPEYISYLAYDEIRIKKLVAYTLRNNYLYVLNNKNVEWVLIEAIFPNGMVDNICGTNGCGIADNNEYMVSRDIIALVVKDILTELNGGQLEPVK